MMEFTVKPAGGAKAAIRNMHDTADDFGGCHVSETCCTSPVQVQMGLFHHYVDVLDIS